LPQRPARLYRQEGKTTAMTGLKERNILITGVANKYSIAWTIARALTRAGANLAFTYQDDRFKPKVARLLAAEMPEALLLPCNVASDAEIEALFDKLKAELGTLHGLVHSIAYAPSRELAGRYLDTTRDGFKLAQEISAYSLVALSRRAYPLMTGGGSIITLTFFGSRRVVPHYNLMGVAKAALEASVRYLAYELGPHGVRVNAISAGPVRTLSAKGIRNFNEMLRHAGSRNPLGRAVEVEAIAATALFLAGDLSRGITGEVIHVDNGCHIMGV
jgi:enoyl-[acyl-carrier protein] reductase I